MPVDPKELLARECYEGSGATVTNCVVHLHLSLTDRNVTSCPRCAVDVQNEFRRAVAINQWLNTWKDEASELLRSIPQGGTLAQ